MKHQKAVKKAVPRVLAIIAASAALALGAAWVRAGERPFPPPSPARIMSHLGEMLDLTEEQKNLLAPVMEASFDRHREIEKKYGKQERDLRRAAREERRAIESNVDGQLASILTAGQMEAYRQLKEDRRSDRRKGGGGHGRGEGRRQGGMSPDRILLHLSERLDLSADQEDRLLPIFEEIFDQRRELYESRGSREAIERSVIRQQMEGLAAELEAQAATVLTAEQMEEFNEILEERHSRKGGRPYGGRGSF